MLRNDIDGAFFRGKEVGKGVFGIRKPASEADYEEWWVVVYYLGVGEGGEVGGFTW